jgi:hypothetical protein
MLSANYYATPCEITIYFKVINYSHMSAAPPDAFVFDNNNILSGVTNFSISMSLNNAVLRGIGDCVQIRKPPGAGGSPQVNFATLPMVDLVASRVELSTSLEFAEFEALVMYPQRRPNYLDANCSMEFALLLPSATATLDFMSEVLRATGGGYVGRWAIAVEMAGTWGAGATGATLALRVRGIFVLDEATLNITESMATVSLSGSMIIGSIISA